MIDEMRFFTDINTTCIFHSRSKYIPHIGEHVILGEDILYEGTVVDVNHWYSEDGHDMIDVLIEEDLYED